MWRTAVGTRWRKGSTTRVQRDLSIINAMRAWVGLASTTVDALGIPGWVLSAGLLIMRYR
ncbi:hypothetical protein LSUB1_G002110 [Lachnellula subtilissima]|uniref:Uncharacterized protein n=1 Tax=Lachnellula subtilissima TaxID=602034 RepID=A0A8H8UGA5_9HELO|nr:hypothetical protein LSUB1_G002110 [Lachnellula subtilissima]